MECEVTCVVCSDMYGGGEMEPISLPACGHTFCRGCLRGVAMTGAGVSCPTCRVPHQGPPAHDLPPVFALLSLASHYTNTQGSAGGDRGQDGGAGGCRRHGSKQEFWCRECCEALCGHCLLDGHVRLGHVVQPVHTVVAEKQREVRQVGRQILKKVKQIQLVLRADLAHLLARLVRAAQLSQALKAITTKTDLLLHQANASTTLEATLLTATLMKSLEAEVAKVGPLSPGQGDGEPGRVRCMSCSQATNPTPPQLWQVDQEATSPLQEVTEAVEDSRQKEWEEGEGEAGWEPSDLSRQPPHQALLQQDTQQNHGQEEHHHDEVNQEAEQEQEENRRSNVEGEEEDAAGEESEGCGKVVWCWVVGGRGRRGGLRWENGRLHLTALTLHPQRPHTHQTHLYEPPDSGDRNHSNISIQLPLVETLMPRAAPLVYLDVSTGERFLGRVYIRLWGHLRRAQHFLALCTGTLGPSYLGGTFHGVAKKDTDGETLAGGRYQTEGGGTSVKGLVEGLEWGGEHVKAKRVGLVVGASGGRPDFDAFFHICTRGDPNGNFGCAFGEVVNEGEEDGAREKLVTGGAGMEVVQMAVNHLSLGSVYISDCGLALPKPDMQ